MNQEPQKGMIRKEWGKYLALAAVGLMVAIAIGNTLNHIKNPQELERKIRQRQMQNYERRQRQTGAGEVTIRLSGCVSVPANTGYTGALCDWAGGDPETAVATVWVVTPSRPADGTTLTCPAEGFAQRGERRCTAGGRTFWLEPVR